MTTTTRTLLLAVVAVLAIVALAATAFGAPTLMGGATNDGGEIVLTSNTSDADSSNDFSVVVFDVLAGTTFADLDTLSTDFNVTDDGCAGGSPRFQIRVDTGSDIKNIFAYLGPEPNYNTCTLNTMTGSGDVLDESRKIDTSQVGGEFYDSYADAVANYGSYPVLSVSLVADAGWAFGDGEQTVRIDNVNIDGETFDFTPEPPPPPGPTDKDQCKKGGWQDFTDPSFKNQGQCVSHFNRNR